MKKLYGHYVPVYCAILLSCCVVFMGEATKHKASRTPAVSKTSKKNAVIPRYFKSSRFGDKLLGFSHALYFAIKNKFDIFLVPFPYSDQLVIDDLLPKVLPNMKKRYIREIVFSGGNTATIHTDVQNVLFIIKYFPDAEFRPFTTNTWHMFPVDWEDEEFKNTLHTLIKPKVPLSLIELPKNKILVALHVRKGGGFDDWDTQKNGVATDFFFYKAPLDEYYINQLKKVYELFGDVPLYVFLFTDDPNPQALADKYKKLSAVPGLEIDCRKEGNHHTANVLEDFFSMMQFDVLIRPMSNFSVMAEKLGNHSIVISPGEYLPNSHVQKGLITIKKPLPSMPR